MSDCVFISFLSSDESEYQTAGVFDAGLFGSAWTIVADGPPGSDDITLDARAQMLFWEDETNISVMGTGFYSWSLDRVFASGAYLDFSVWEIVAAAGKALLYGGDVDFGGTGVVFRIDPNLLKVEAHLDLSSKYYGNNDTPMNIGGHIMPLTPQSITPPGTRFPIIGCANDVQLNLGTYNSDLLKADYKSTGYISKKPAEIVDQRFFKTGNGDIYGYYHNTKGRFIHRKLDNAGKPKGASKTAFKIKKKRLKWMDSATFGNQVLTAFSQMKNKKKYEIFFNAFTVK